MNVEKRRETKYNKVIISYSHITLSVPRKFRSQTSDNMDRWKAEQRRGREKRKIRREKIRRERVRRKKTQMREKVGKSRFTAFFHWFVAKEGRKVGSLKRRVRSQLARWEMKNCTPLWREAHFQVKMHHNTTTTTAQLHSTTLHYTKLHYTTLHYTPLHYSTPHYTTLYHTTFH